MKLIDKSALVAEIEKLMNRYDSEYDEDSTEVNAAKGNVCHEILCTIDSLKVKEVDLMIHTIIAECCDWLAMNTNLSHDEIEGCRNLMLTVKKEQLKAQKGK